jgi:ATP-dependent RNA helicase DeaD
MVSVEFNRFINYYKKTRDLSSQSSGERRESDGAPRDNSGAVRYFVNIGSRDNFDWMSLKDFLKETLDLGRDDVFKVDVKEGFSFFNTDAEHSDKVMDILNGIELEGRKINVEISKNDGGGRSNSRRDHNGRSGGGFGGGRSGGGGFRSDRSSSAPKREGGFRSDRGGSSDRPARRGEGFSSDRPRREGGFSERAPRRSDAPRTDAPRARRPRKD